MTAPLGSHTWPEIDRASLVAVPIGSCEQHGPHLPLDTDTRIATELARRLALGMADVVVAPAIGVSASGEHAGFPGTLSIGSDVTRALVVELVRSADWASGVVLVNGHGGNRAAIDAAVATSSHDGRHVLSWWPRVEGADAHAGRTETSIMLALAPDVVRSGVAARGATETMDLIGGRLRAEGVRAVSPNGVLGDPSGASAEEGHELLRGLAADLVDTVDAWRRDGR